MSELHVAGASPWNGHPDAREVAEAAQTLTLLTEQADQVRAELVKLRRELAEAQRDFSAYSLLICSKPTSNWCSRHCTLR